MIIPGKFSMQIDVPHLKYGECEYFMPNVLQDWLGEQDLQGRFTHSGSWGNGYTNGRTNRESSYSVDNI